MQSSTEDRVVKCYQELMGGDRPPLHSNAFQLGMDSLDCIEFLMVLEEEFDIEVADEEAEKWKSLLDVVNYIELRS